MTSQKLLKRSKYGEGRPQRLSMFVWFVRFYLLASLGLLANILNFGFPAAEVLFEPIWAILYGASAVLFIRLIATSGLSTLGWTVTLFGLLPSISFLWSVLPNQSLVLGTGLTSNILFAIVLGSRMSWPGIILNARWAINAMLVWSLAAVLFGYQAALYLDGLNRTNYLGGEMLQGMFTHKNFLGVYSSIGLLLNLATLRGYRRILMVILSLYFVLSAGTSTGLIALVAGLTTFLFFIILRLRMLAGAIGSVSATALLVALFLAFAYYGEVLEMLGRDESLTGRTDLWQWAIQFFLQKPFFGWGYGGIFNSSGAGPSDIFFSGFYRAPHFHSGYLQILAELGIVGFLPTILLLTSLLYRSTKNSLSAPDYTATAVVSIMVSLALVFLGMNILLRYNDFTTVLLVALFISRAPKETQRDNIRENRQL